MHENSQKRKADSSSSESSSDEESEEDNKSNSKGSPPEKKSKTSENTAISHNKWESLDFGDANKTEKFRRLMGIKSDAPPPSVKVKDIKDPIMAMAPKTATKVVFDDADSDDDSKDTIETKSKKRKAENSLEKPSKKQRQNVDPAKEVSDSGIEESSDTNEANNENSQKVTTLPTSIYDVS